MSFSSATFTYLAQIVRDHSAIVLDESKAYLVESRLGPLLYSEGLRDIDELAFRLRDERHSPLLRKVLDAMTNNETWFFRDLYPFEALKTAILPQLVAHVETDKTLSVWSSRVLQWAGDL
jgi:chemotaxis protein methyltransferase CheR